MTTDRIAVVDPSAGARLLAHLLRCVPQALGSAKVPDRPGIYVLHASRVDHPLYAPLRNSTSAIYVGSAERLVSRVEDHRRSIDAATALDVEDFDVRYVPTCTMLDATTGERILQQILRPIWCEPRASGFGSRRQGASREDGQLETRWDALHPGRAWATTMKRRDRSAVAAVVAAMLSGPVR